MPSKSICIGQHEHPTSPMNPCLFSAKPVTLGLGAPCCVCVKNFEVKNFYFDIFCAATPCALLSDPAQETRGAGRGIQKQKRTAAGRFHATVPKEQRVSNGCGIGLVPYVSFFMRLRIKSRDGRLIFLRIDINRSFTHSIDGNTLRVLQRFLQAVQNPLCQWRKFFLHHRPSVLRNPSLIFST